MPTPNSGIPYVPENTTDPAAGLNLSLHVIDALLTPEVLGLGTTTPPVSPADGDLYVVGPAATGDWSGEDENLARYVAEGDFWQFYTAGVQAKAVLYLGAWYTFQGSSGWVGAGVPSVTASDVSYDNSTSGLTATEAQSAIDELAASVGPSSDRSSVTALSISSGVVNIDYSLGDYFTLSLTSNVTSITFSNLPGSGKGASLALLIKQDATGGRTVALPSSFKQITGSDSSVQSSANAYTRLHITTNDNGTRWGYSMKAEAA